MLPTTQRDYSSSAIHFLLHFLIIKKKKVGGNKEKKKRQHALVPNKYGGKNHDKEGMSEVGGSEHG